MVSFGRDLTCYIWRRLFSLVYILFFQLLFFGFGVGFISFLFYLLTFGFSVGFGVGSKHILNYILVSFSSNLNITFFQLVASSPMYVRRHKLIVFGFVNNNPRVQVMLKLDCPLFLVTEWWRQNCSKGVRACETTYAGSIRHWEEEVREST